MKKNRTKSSITLFILLLALIMLFVGCEKKEEEDKAQDTQDQANDEPDTDTDTEPDQDQDVDAVSTPSIVVDEETLNKAMGKEGSWIIILTEDLTVESDIVLEGEFEKPDSDDSTQLVPSPRKIALYAQDADRNKTDSFTLKAPKMTVKSKDAKIQGGTFQGDVYIEANGFQVIDGEIDGNVYFANDEVEASFDIENGGSVTGSTMIKDEE